MNYVEIHGARVHNLKNIDLRIPKDQIVVVTGVSGSGKSSLVFDLLFAEGRKRYLESQGALPTIEIEEPFDYIEGLQPTVAVQQRLIRESNPRSVVGTKIRILNILNLVYAADAVDESGANSELPASYFSFNSPLGMCFECSGRGYVIECDVDELTPDHSATLAQIQTRVCHFGEKDWAWQGRLAAFARYWDVTVDTPYVALSAEIRESYIHGMDRRPEGPRWVGAVPFLREQKLKGRGRGRAIFRASCSLCGGDRIGEPGRTATIAGRRIGQLAQMSIVELAEFLHEVRQSLSPFSRNSIAVILRKIDHLINVGLSYLKLYREMPSLSGGEIQRLFLMSHLDAEMEALIYVFDEPTAGLHESEKERLIGRLDALCAQGNSVVVVEHDPNIIARASHVIDIGPLAGQRGGEVVYQGDYAGLIEVDRSITGLFLSGREPMPRRARIDIDPDGPSLKLTGVATNNLKRLSVQIPLGVIVGIAGVSGSGKSSLVADTLIPLLRAYFARLRETKQAEEQLRLEYFPIDPLVESFAGAEPLQGYAEVSQAPTGRNRTSNVVSYIGIWDALRTLFARQPQAREKGLEAGHFSFNSAGACSGCGGSGVESVYLGNMQVEYTCRECGGRRYNPETLEISYKGLNIAEVLELSVAEAVVLFEEEAPIHHMLDLLAQTGMDYVSLGQTAPTLSGGESQRVKLAKELGRRRWGSVLYVIDEPTTGLSLYDVAKLLPILARLTVRGHSVVLTEHDPDVLSFCDWIIELGPGGGEKGGEIITQGAPEALAADPRSQVGKYLHC